MKEEDLLQIRASAVNLVIPEAYHSEVIRNLALLENYIALLNAVELPERLEPAFEYSP